MSSKYVEKIEICYIFLYNPDQEKFTTRRKKIQLNESIPNKDGSTASHTTQNSTTVPIEGAHVTSTEDVSLTFNKGNFC
jgi:hypothetical protein